MAEEKPNASSTGIVGRDDAVLSHDDLSALEYVLEHVKGSSPTSVSMLAVEDSGE